MQSPTHRPALAKQGMMAQVQLSFFFLALGANYAVQILKLI